MRIAASRTRASRKPIATVNGSLSAATNGGSTALRMPTIAATATAPPKPFSSAPGARPAASNSASADPSHAIARRTGCRRGRSGLQTGTFNPSGDILRRLALAVFVELSDLDQLEAQQLDLIEHAVQLRLIA